MRVRHAIAIVGICLCAGLPVEARDHRSGIGAGLTSGSFDADNLPDAVDFTGYTVYWKIGITDGWGLLLSYRDMEDDEDLFLNEEDDYTQVGVQAVYMWRHGKIVRPHIKFGLTRTEFEARSPFLGSASDDKAAISFGGGLEVGSKAIAFFGDFDYSEPELFGVDSQIGNLTVGIIFKF